MAAEVSEVDMKNTQTIEAMNAAAEADTEEEFERVRIMGSIVRILEQNRT